MNGIYFNIKQEIVPVFFTNTENKIKIFFDYGLRDEKQKGLAHMYEHLIISYLKDKYKNLIDKINGYTDIDLIQIEITCLDRCLCKLFDDIINDDFSGIINENYYIQNCNLINQEFILQKRDIITEIQNNIYNNFHLDQNFKNILDQNTVPISLNSLKKNFDKFIKSISLIFISDTTKHFNFVNIKQIPQYKNYKNSLPDSKHITKKSLNFNNGILLIKLALININNFEFPDDIYYIRLLSLIINKRLEILKENQVYFSMCYPIFHRYELYFTIVASTNADREILTFNNIKDILESQITKQEINFITQKSNNLNKQEKIYKEKITALYKANEFLNENFKKEINLNRINYLFYYIVNQINKSIKLY